MKKGFVDLGKELAGNIEGQGRSSINYLSIDFPL
jgi:hypothetical protein